MDMCIKVLITIFCIILCYLIGAIPNGLIIGKIFKKTDIREFGSHNTGGTNVGRVLGKKLGALTIVMDAFKIIIPFWILRILLPFFIDSNIHVMTICYIALLMACVGHCYPVYCHFKGGKAVATFFGCLIATNYVLLLVFIAVFAIILISKRMVSLASILGSIVVSVVAILMLGFNVGWVGMWPMLNYEILYTIVIMINTLILINRHSPNIDRILLGQESQIKWLKSKK